MNKKQKEANKLIERTKNYSVEEAIELMPTISTSKFAGSVELIVNLKLSEKQKSEQIRGHVIFPHSFGENTRILVLAENSKHEEAKSAGADYVGMDDLIKKIEEGWIDFDVLITTPSLMPKIAKLGKYLGKRGLMPNPKNQTVTEDIKKAISIYKKGKKDFKKNDQDSIRIVIGKTNMTKEQLVENFEEFKKALMSEIKKFGTNPISKVHMAPTMGPGIKLSPAVFD